jgi:nucleoid-associated protein YgaU
MTRENKLALVIGFALILFVGVLVSDHFSAARTIESADLTSQRDALLASNPPVAAKLIDLAPAVNTPASADPEHLGGKEKGSDPFSFPVFRNPDLHARQRSAETASDQNGVVVHQVRAGETLIAISRRYFGDGSRVKELAALNDLRDPAAIKPGDRLRVPAAAPSSAGTAPSASTAEAGKKKGSDPFSFARTYTVKSSDTLMEISQRMLGTTKRWREIAAMNQDVITDPDRLEVGAVIRIPAASSTQGAR